MPGEAAAMTRSWRVGKRTVTATVPQVRAGQVQCTSMEWDPDMPRKLSRREWQQYRAGRDAAFAELFAELGIKGAVVEI